MSARALVGVNFGEGLIAAAELRPAPEGAVLDKLCSSHERLACVLEGEVSDPFALSRELKRFWRSCGLKNRSVILSIANQKVITREIDVPSMEESELRSALLYLAQQYLPLAVENSQIDFEIRGESERNGEKVLRVLLVAAHKDMLMDYVRAFQGAGLDLRAIDVDAFCIQRSLLPYPESLLGEDETEKRSICLLNIGYELSTFAIVIRNMVKFVRLIRVGLADFVEALKDKETLRELGLQPEDCEKALRDVGVSLFVDPLLIVNQNNVEQKLLIAEVVKEVAESFANEVRKTIDYYLVEDEALEVSHVVISGEGALIRGLDKYLSREIDLDVEIGNPLRNVRMPSTRGFAAKAETALPRYATAIGAALRSIYEP